MPRAGSGELYVHVPRYLSYTDTGDSLGRVSSAALRSTLRSFTFAPQIASLTMMASAIAYRIRRVGSNGVRPRLIRRFLGSAGSGSSSRFHLPDLGQNGTLVIRVSDPDSSSSVSKVKIIPQWRDDTILELRPVSDEDAPCDEAMPMTPILGNDTTSMNDGTTVTSRKEGIATSLGRRGALAEISLGSKGLRHDVDKILIATVPEKCNLTCHLERGDIEITSKLEGDASLSTSDGNISVSKLRGHSVSLSTEGCSSASTGIIFVKKAIEARTVDIATPTRIRAQMINGSSVRISALTKSVSMEGKLDADDGGAAIDIGSLYVSSGASVDDSAAELTVRGPALNDKLVRVKSSHGHLSVDARLPIPRTCDKHPLVDLGGVNGSCDVLVEASCGDKSEGSFRSNAESAAVRCHFHSITPESISSVTCRGKLGETSITLDRKLECEIRLLSVDKLPAAIDAEHLLELDDHGGEIEATVKRLKENLLAREKQSSLPVPPAICIETEAYDDDYTSIDDGVSMKLGCVRNRSEEPDSRFDRAQGKINIDGAASQALSGFQTQKTGPAGGFDSQPLLLVAADGGVKLETLSWFGSIARRYDMEENSRDLGRQATRSSRLRKT